MFVDFVVALRPLRKYQERSAPGLTRHYVTGDVTARWPFAKSRFAQFAGCVPGMGNNLGVKVPYRLGSGNC
jgi:hypothetical protein